MTQGQQMHCTADLVLGHRSRRVRGVVELATTERTCGLCTENHRRGGAATARSRLLCQGQYLLTGNCCLLCKHRWTQYLLKGTALSSTRLSSAGFPAVCAAERQSEAAEHTCTDAAANAEHQVGDAAGNSSVSFAAM